MREEEAEGRPLLLRLYLILTCLVLGLATNIGLAMWAAFKTPRPVPLAARLGETTSDAIQWPGPVPTDWPSSPIDQLPDADPSLDQFDKGPTVRSARSCWRSSEELEIYRSFGGHFFAYTRESFGVPWRCLRRDFTSHTRRIPEYYDDVGERPVEGVLGGAGWQRDDPRSPSPDDHMPIVPISNGLILNTALFSLVFAIGAIALRWAARRYIPSYATLRSWLLMSYLILTCLAVGITGNIGIATWAAFKTAQPTKAPAASPAPVAILNWPGPVPSDWPPTPNSAVPGYESDPIRPFDSGPRTSRGHSRWRSLESVTIHRSVGGTAYWYESEQFGYPWRSLRRDHTHSLMMSATPGNDDRAAIGPLGGLGVHRGWNTWWSFRAPENIPVVPLVYGFVGNTLLYSIPPAGLMLIPLLLRRRRAKAGECTSCRYPVVGLALCPECGTPNTNPPPPLPVQSA